MESTCQEETSHAEEAVFWHRQERIVAVNDQACRILGYSRKELQSMCMEQVAPGVPIKTGHDKACRNGSVVLNADMRHREGHRIATTMTLTAHESNGETLYCGIARQISTDPASVDQRSSDELHSRVEELQRAERRIRLAIEGGRLGTFGWVLPDPAMLLPTSDSSFLNQCGSCEVSDSLYRMFGREPGSVYPTYTAFATQVHPDDLLRLERVLGIASRTGRPVAQETRIVWPDGSIHWVEIRGMFSFSPEGHAFRLDGVMVDIDEKKQAEIHLTESEQNLKLALHAGQLGLWEWNQESGVITCSADSLQIFGYEAGRVEVTWDLYVSHIHAEDLNRVLAILRRAWARQEEVHIEHRIQDAVGAFRWIELRGQFAGDDQKPAARMSGVVSDITHRKLADEELQLRRFAVDVAGEAMLTLQMDGRIVDANQVACERLGYTRQELLRKKLTQNSSPQFDALVQDLTSGRGTHVIPARHRRRDGVVIDVELSAKMFSYRGQDFLCVTARDVTMLRIAQRRHRELDQQLAHMNRLASLGQLASAIAHELNQPLSVVANSAAFLQLGLPDNMIDQQKAVEMCELISSQAVKAGEIVRRMRGFCLNKPPKRSLVNLNKLIEESLQLVEPELRHNRIKAQSDLASSIPMVQVDRVQIQQVLINLIKNSIDAMVESTQKERILRISTIMSQSVISIAVSDSGPGIPIEEQSQIFRPFESSKDDGMGMGLAISRSIVEAHSGRLTVGESAGTGATFFIDLPLLASEGHEQQSS